MTNIEIANLFLEKMDVNIHVQSSGKENIPEDYANEIIAKAAPFCASLDEEYIALEDVEGFYSYVVNNLRLQIEGQGVRIDKDYESATLTFQFSRKPLR